ncbi:MAG TPA: peroxiredoxin family protein [Marmoricola sp.]|nr:peroxiredoxin family protein [Marmoricola sp.]
MTSTTASRRNDDHRQQVLARIRQDQARQDRKRRLIFGIILVVAVAGVVAVMMATSRSTSATTTRAATDFTLTNTAGQEVRLADFRGKSNVVLYFSEGAGCGSCLQQMAAIEKDKAAFDRAGVTVLPIVMNTRDQITEDMATYGVTTPFLLDDGKVSTAYKTIGRGMHAGLPGHSFVLIDKTGTQLWFGEYPSMYVSTSDLLRQVTQRLG